MEIEFLVKKAKAGDKEALVKLIMLQREAYYKLAFVLMKNKEDALDALEDMIVILYEEIGRLKKEGAFYPWSKTILVNCCRRHLKNRSKVIPMDQLEDHFQPQGDAFKQMEDQILLEKYLSGLSQKQQEVLKLRYFLDLDYETIAALLRIPLGTVKSRINGALNKLKFSFGGEGYEKD